MPGPFTSNLPLNLDLKGLRQALRRYRDWRDERQLELEAMPPGSRHRQSLQGNLAAAQASLERLVVLNDWVTENDDLLTRQLTQSKNNILVPFVWNYGLCTAYALDYLLSRRAGAEAGPILAAMRHPASQSRLVETQTLQNKLITLPDRADDGRRSWLSSRTGAASHAYRYHLAALGDYKGVTAARSLQFRTLAPSRLVPLGRVKNTLTLGVLLALWPDHVDAPWSERLVDRPDWGPDAKGGAGQGGRHRPNHRPDVSVWMLCLEWREQVRRMMRRAEGFPFEELFLCRLGVIEGSANHYIVLDFQRPAPGIFDPNFGFMPLNPRAPLDAYTDWLLAMLFYYYKVEDMTLYAVQLEAPAAGAGPACDLKFKPAS